MICKGLLNNWVVLGVRCWVKEDIRGFIRQASDAAVLVRTHAHKGCVLHRQALQGHALIAVRKKQGMFGLVSKMAYDIVLNLA